MFGFWKTDMTVKLLEQLVTPERINAAFDEYMAQYNANDGRRTRVTLQISKEQDNNWWVHVCQMQYKVGKWQIASIIKSNKVTDLLKQLICKTKELKESR